jgi:hypothetical protein
MYVRVAIRFRKCRRRDGTPVVVSKRRDLSQTNDFSDNSVKKSGAPLSFPALSREKVLGNDRSDFPERQWPK